MKALTTFILALAVAVIGVGGYLQIQNIQSRLAQLEQAMPPQVVTAPTEVRPESVAQTTRLSATKPRIDPPAPTTVPPAQAAPAMSPKAESRSYLNELLELTQQ